ncbi:hypothetical protein ASD74_04260 [Rhizobium sp. Root564]|nr:hypothetical protein ASD74_04260 [Rhizobium sp. Root564]
MEVRLRAFELIDERDARKSRPISTEVSEAVIKLFVEGGAVDEEDADAAYLIFDEMRREKRRLGCPCKDGRRPRLYAARPDNIKRMPNYRIEHSKGCVFEDRPTSYGVMVNTSYATYNGDTLGIHDDFATDAVQSGKGGARGNNRRPPKISRILYSLIEKAGLNVALSESWNSPEKALTNAAQEIIIARDNRSTVKLSEVLVVSSQYGGDFVRQFIQLRRRVAGWSDWPSGSRPQFYLCGIATGFNYNRANERYDITIKDRRPRFVDSKPYVFAGDATIAKAPFAYILSYSKSSPRSNILHGLKCFLHPIYSEEIWCPVDSNRERETLSQLLQWQGTHPLGSKMKIEKPLSGVVIDGKMCLPDFLVHIPSLQRSVVVETMGLLTTDYENRKIATHGLMEARWGPVVQHRLAGQRPSVANSDLVTDLDQIVAQWL